MNTDYAILGVAGASIVLLVLAAITGSRGTLDYATGLAFGALIIALAKRRDR